MIALIIASHGELAEKLVDTSEMIFGKQENIGVVNFLPGENFDNLKNKYEEQLDKLDTKDGVLFLVDIFGGSPFKVASSVALNDENMDIIAGMSLPMLLEIYKTRDYLNLEQVVKFAKETAQAGIKSLKGNK